MAVERLVDTESTMNLVRYLVIKCTERELSKARLVKMLYLIDWKGAVDYQRQFTPLHWQYNHYGPYVPSVIQEIVNDPSMTLVARKTEHGSMGEYVHADHETLLRELREHTPDLLPLPLRDVADFVVATTQELSFNDFIKLVYSTYPVCKSQKYSYLDLEALAQDYRLTEKSL